MAKGDLILAADFGTSGVKIGAVTRDMRLLATAIEPYPLFLPAPSCAEQNPEDWWDALVRGVARLQADVPDLADRAASLVFGAQMCGLVCADADGHPLRPALVWLDKRAAPLMRKTVRGTPSVAGYRADMGLRWAVLANGAPSLNGMDPTGKMLWIKAHEPEIYAATAHFLDAHGWLLRRATGAAAMTTDNANLTWLMDTRRGHEGWSQRLADQVGLDLERMPPIIGGDAVAGGLTRVAATQLGLRAGTPVVAGGGDVSASAIGSGAVEDGALHICLSTSAWIAGFWDRRVLSPTHAYATITGPVAYRPLLIATQESAGSALGWLAEIIDPERHAGGAGLDEFYRDLGEPRDDDPLFLPWLAGERVPVDEERLRGGFHGLSLRHDRAALKRSVIEGVALNLRWAWSKVIRRRGAQTQGAVPMIGGAAENPALAQAVADALNRPVRVGEARYSGVLGAAAMAMPSLGWAETVWQAAGKVQNQSGILYDPQPDRVALLNARAARIEPLRRAMVRLYRREG